ncbi:ParB/RepB/Spo0J family partition protein [Mycetocola lacteus]|uniref:ParB/RepB/Spo0J family partition protein n=1 Tax=Mycetocola lacteus TaxID=76637 RepID=A0A3L7AXE9_9MICO|nr:MULTISPECIES: ParB/RepB/Spo0J family partition protein [Mycetocola]MCS4277121.1 ParB family chromosome partitioning protein [Mycetocola sp. BIGb0189]RLP84210.1 ParB/RepB/Spo0J family partition protein [Mycetocola lacteus]
MATKRTGLGRGIGALIPTSDNPTASRPVDVFFPATEQPAGKNSGAKAATDAEPQLVSVPGARLIDINPADVIPNAVQPRTYFEPEALAELVVSIREVGVLQPIVVRTHPTQAGKYELIMGERRLRASREVGLERIPAVVKETADEDMLRDALLENLHRSQLNPLEEASAYQQLLSDFGITQEQLAERIGRSRPQISNTLRLLKLPASVQKKVAAGVLSAGHARAILSVNDLEKMHHLADKIINEDLSVRAAESAATKSAPPRSSKPVAGNKRGYLDEVAETLADRLNTRVKVTLGARKGSVTIDFATVGDLNRILRELGQSIDPA